MEYSMQADKETNTLEVIKKDKNIAKMSDEEQKNLAKFLDGMNTALFSPYISKE